MIDKFYKVDEFISSKFEKYRKYISISFLYVIPTILFSILMYNFYLGEYWDFSVEMGELGFKLILLMIFITPISKIFSKINLLKKVLSFRKELGMLCFWALSIHFIGLSLIKEIFTNFNNLFLENYLIFGFLGYVGIFLLGVTSNKFSMELLGKKWIVLHKLLYLIFVLAIIHIVLIKGELSQYLILIVFIILKLFIYFKFNKKKK